MNSLKHAFNPVKGVWYGQGTILDVKTVANNDRKYLVQSKMSKDDIWVDEEKFMDIEELERFWTVKNKKDVSNLEGELLVSNADSQFQELIIECSRAPCTTIHIVN